MSPEQIRAQQLDQRSDLFSLASVTYEILTGSVAFTAGSVPEVLMRVVSGQPPDLSSILPDADPELQPALSWAMQKDPKERPQTVAIWVEKISPLLRKSASPVAGWQFDALFDQRTVPGDPETDTTQV